MPPKLKWHKINNKYPNKCDLIIIYYEEDNKHICRAGEWKQEKWEKSYEKEQKINFFWAKINLPEKMTEIEELITTRFELLDL